MQQVTLTTALGTQIDITELVAGILRLSGYPRYDSPESTAWLGGMARKLIAAGGDEAPAHVFLAIGHLLPPEFTDHLLDVWDRVVSEVRRDLGDDQAADD